MMSKRFLKRYPLAIVTDIKSFKGALFFIPWVLWLRGTLHWEEHGPLPKNSWRLQMAGFRRLSAFAFDSCKEEHFIPV